MGDLLKISVFNKFCYIARLFLIFTDQKWVLSTKDGHDKGPVLHVFAQSHSCVYLSKRFVSVNQTIGYECDWIATRPAGRVPVADRY